MSQLPISALVGRNVRRLREMNGLTVAHVLSRIASTGSDWAPHQTSFSRRENGQAPITVDELVLLASALGVSPAVLLTYPACMTCLDVPPSGFTCNACGAGGAR